MVVCCIGCIVNCSSSMSCSRLAVRVGESSKDVVGEDVDRDGSRRRGLEGTPDRRGKGLRSWIGSGSRSPSELGLGKKFEEKLRLEWKGGGMVLFEDEGGGSTDRTREIISSCRPVLWEIGGSVWKLEALGRMCGRWVKAEGKAAGMASKSILVKADANWLDGAPMACKARAIQIMVVGGARAFPRCL